MKFLLRYIAATVGVFAFFLTIKPLLRVEIPETQAARSPASEPRRKSELRSLKAGAALGEDNAEKRLTCQGRYIHEDTQQTLTLTVGEVYEDQAPQCDCFNDKIIFGTNYESAPLGYTFLSDCKVVYPKTRLPKHRGQATVYNFESKN